VQAFAVSDDQPAQERPLENLSRWNDGADDIRNALTQNEIAATDKRARFVTVDAYELAGGIVRRDLFAEGEEGVFLLDADLLDRLSTDKLQTEADALRPEGWKWIEVHPDFDYEARMEFRQRHPEPLPPSEEARAEEKLLTKEYKTLFNSMQEDDEEASARLDAIEARIAELEDTEPVFTPDTLAIAGTMVTVGRDGEVEVIRGLIRPDDFPHEFGAEQISAAKIKAPFSAALVENLTAQKSAAISASLCGRPDIALSAVVYALALDTLSLHSRESAIRMTARRNHLQESCVALDAMEEVRAKWSGIVPGEVTALWQWCLIQDQKTLLELLAFCAACTVDAVQRNQDRPDCQRLAHAGALATALGLDMAAWFTATADNYFTRVSRADIFCALAEAKGSPAKRSWEKLRKSELAALAEREVSGTGWLPLPLRTIEVSNTGNL
jgi:ParB family chromosome partitioning protein